MKPTLYNYQQDMLIRLHAAFESHAAVLCQMPTGTGKTMVLASFIREVAQRQAQPPVVWIIAHRRELVEQINAHIDTLMGSEGAAYRDRIQAMSIQWLSVHAGEVTDIPDLIVIDEAHHALAATYRELWERYPKARILGMTATPCRLNGRGFTDLFGTLVPADSVADFIRGGWLSPFDYVSIGTQSEAQRLIDGLKKRGADGDYQVKEMDSVLNRRPSIRSLYESIRRYAPGRKGIVYAISIAHARNIADYYCEQGLKAVAIDSKTPTQQRKDLVADFKEGRIEVLVNVDVFSEGFDCPDVEFVQMARPTLSLAKYLQQVGRGLRKVKGKQACVLIDNVGLYRLFGLPTAERDWQGMFEGRMAGKARIIERRAAQAYAAAAVRVRPIEEEDACGMCVVMTHDRLLEELAADIQPTVSTDELWKKGRLLRNDILVVTESDGRTCYIDLRNQARYRKKPVVVRLGCVELLHVGDCYYSRTKRVYRSAEGMERRNIQVGPFFVNLYDFRVTNPKYRQLHERGRGIRYDIVCLLEQDAEDYYHYGGNLADGSIIVADRELRYYHVEAGKEKRYIACEHPAGEEEDFDHAVSRLCKEADERVAERHRERLSDMQGAEPFRSGQKWGLKQGERILIPPLYRNLLPPVGLYCAFEDNPCQWGVLRLDGKVVVEPRYAEVNIGSDGTVRLMVVKDIVKTVKLDC